jgi:hypothetical protein
MLDLVRHAPSPQRRLQRQDTPGFARHHRVLPHAQPQQGGPHRAAHGWLPALLLPTALGLAQAPTRLTLPVPPRDRPTFAGEAHHGARRPLGQRGPQEGWRRGAPVTPRCAHPPRDRPPRTQTQAGARRPTRLAPGPPRRSGTPGAWGLLVRPRGPASWARGRRNGLPRAGPRQDNAPAAGALGRGPVLAPAPGRGGALGRRAAPQAPLRPTRGDPRRPHRAPHAMGAVRRRRGVGQQAPHAPRHALAVPRRPPPPQAPANKPGRRRAETPRGAPGRPSPHRGRRPFGGAGQGIKRAGATQRTRRCPCPSVAGRRRPTRQAGRGAGGPLALASKGGRPGETAGLTRRQQRRRRGRPRHPVGMLRQSRGTKPGSAGQAILMGSAIASEETAPNVDAGWPQGAWTPFSFDLQGLDGLGCKF